MLIYSFSICLFWGLNLITKPLFKAIKNPQRFTVDGDSELRRQKIIVNMKLAISFGIIMAIVSLGQSAPTTEDLQKMQIGRGMEQFGYRWAKEILKKSENQNVISSGVSTGLTLAMTALGAGGKTKTEIKSALDLPESDEVIKSVMKRITEGIDKPRKVNIKIANRIFTQDGFEMNQEFKAATGDAFRAEAQNLDFSHKPDEASKTINDWVESKTNNRIKNLVSSDGVKDSSMVLVNAIYFNGKWAKPFEHSAPKLWHMDDKVSKNVSTMHLRGRFKHGALQGVDANFVILPYESDSGSEEQFYMFIIIPNEITGLKNVEDNLENVKWDASIKAGHAKKLHIDMPKFKVESTIDIKPILEKMGVNDMFSDKADFTGISKDTPLRVSKAVQKAFIDVNEEGSEAAAATAIGIAPMSLPIMPEPEIHVEIDHPFLFTIMMGKGMVQQPLFSGRIVDPKYE